LQKLKRNINIGFRVDEKEKQMIARAQARTGIRNLRAYLLKMAVDGLVVNLDFADVRECSRLLRIVSNNVNQLAKHANGGGSVCAGDLYEIKAQLGGIWDQQEKIIKSLAKILEAV